MPDKETRKYDNAVYDFEKTITNSPYWGFLVLEKQTLNEDNTLSQKVLTKLIKGQKASKDFDEDFFLESIMSSIIAIFFAEKGLSRDEAKLYLDSDKINELINQAYDLKESNEDNFDNLNELKNH